MDSIRDSDKQDQQNQQRKLRSLTNVFHSLHGQLLMVQNLILALKADNVEACFIFSGY